jgi:hypothetical protein
MFKLSILNISLNIPKFILIFIWCFAGIFIMTAGFADDILNKNEFSISAFSLQISCLAFFIWYSVCYLRSNKKE